MDTKTNAQQNQNHPNPPHPKKKYYPFYALIGFLILLLIGGGVAIIYVSLCILKATDSPPPMQFLIGSLFSLLVLIAVLAQATIYLYQWLAMRDVIKQNERLIKTTQRQARAAERHLEQARELFELVERPSLGVDGGGVLEDGSPTARVLVLIRNSGKSPAIHMSANLTCRFVEPLSVNECPEPGNKISEGLSSRTFLAVNGVTSAIHHIALDDWAQVQQRKSWLMAHLTVTYESLFGKEYYISYYARVNPDGGGFDVCQNHNDAD